MKGVQYLNDSDGKQAFVVIDLAIWRELIEDFLDAALIRSRRGEPDIPWDEAERRLSTFVENISD